MLNPPGLSGEPSFGHENAFVCISFKHKKNVQVLTNLDITFSIVYQLMKNKKLSFPMM